VIARESGLWSVEKGKVMNARLRREWGFRDGILLVALLGLAVVATREAWEEIFLLGWRDEENSYVLLAPLVAAWLFWIRRDRLRFCAPQPTLAGPALVALGAFFGWLGPEYGIDAVWHVGALFVVCGAGLTVLGWRFVRTFLPAVIALLFVLPTPGVIRQAIALPLQNVSANITQSILETFGVPVFLSGNLLTVNDHAVAVAEACNGMRMVSSLALVTYAFVFSVPMRQWVRAAFLIFSPFIALVVNIIRLTPTVLLYGYSSQSVADRFHDFSGWAMLIVALFMLWVFQVLLKWLEIPIVPYSAGQPRYAT